MDNSLDLTQKYSRILIVKKELAQEISNKEGILDITEEFGLPENKLFYTLSEIKNIGLMSVEKAKQLIYSKKLQGIKNGRNWRISRIELIRYLNVNSKGNL
jgi:DNA-directed RNA polymerase specialized sigma subunit